MAMLRLSVRDEEFLMIGDDVKIVFLGSSRRTDTYHDRCPQGCEHRTKQGH